MSFCFKARRISAKTPELNKQRGDIFIESLIAVLLFAIAGAGSSFVTSKMSVSQRDAKVQQQVINELRSMVVNRQESNDLCGGTAIKTDNFSADVNIQGCNLGTAVVNGLSISDVNLPLIVSSTVNVDGQTLAVRVGGAPVPTPTPEP